MNNYFYLKLLTVLFLACVFSLNSHGQDLPNVRLASPKIRELNKYIDFPVDLSTGLPQISVPLHVLKTRGVDIPITLSYHASGIREGQDDGDVGLGWSLGSNYRISRTIYGHADRADISMTPNTYWTTVEGLIGIEKDNYLGRFISDLSPNFSMPPRVGTLLDGEYDHFSYSIPSQAGMFIISNRTNKTISEFNPTNNQYDYLEGISSSGIASGILGF